MKTSAIVTPSKTAADPLDQLVHLSHLVGRDPRLVQPGGGNTSIKEGDILMVKGSGTDLRTIERNGFTRLSLSRLAELRQVESMSDSEMMRFMAGCMVGEGPAPSVETPLHALLPYRVIVHTHDVPTMSLTNIRSSEAQRLVQQLFGGTVTYLPYVRPGFPLARAVARMDRTEGAIGIALAHHGLVVWADNVEQCRQRLLEITGRMDQYLLTRRSKRARGRPPTGQAAGNLPGREKLAEQILPVIRGALGRPHPVILHFDGSPELLELLAADSMSELARRGMATPEHLLRAGRLPIWLNLDLGAAADELAPEIRKQLDQAHAEYQEYHRRHAGGEERPLDDWAKVVLIPGLGVVTAFHDKRNAITANLCYRAVLETITNAESIDRFEFIPEADVFEFEHWPLERRKIEEQTRVEQSTRPLPRQVAVIIGGGSGIGKAAVRRFAEAGAHVVVADLDGAVVDSVAAEVEPEFPGRVVSTAVDVRDDASLDALFQRAVLEFGGIDCLFYTAGLAPRFASVMEIRREDLQRQLEVHYLGAVGAIGRAAAVLRRQGTGGSIVASVSKAALVPGADAVAYGGSKAALLQALRVAAVELGSDGIRVNAINADQIETPLFLQFVRERAAHRGVSFEQQLELYRSRNLLGAKLIPPEAVADLAVLLAGDRFRFTTGDILTIDGGLPEGFPR
jgi:rhamnose utilization protein RhaD (predicted bifunctional aldolase and dehydrogenase)/NAD(P)-dependent dehydrogenase (short-subunit alcohol dehydrogenase family)